MNNIKPIIALFYVTLILLLKVASLHALSHDANDTDIQHCEVCHITATVNFTPLLESETTILPQVEYYCLERTLINNASLVVFNNKHLSSYLYTRPPPKLS